MSFFLKKWYQTYLGLHSLRVSHYTKAAKENINDIKGMVDGKETKAETLYCRFDQQVIKAAYSVTMNIFRKFLFSFKSFVKVELSYVFTIINVQYS